MVERVVRELEEEIVLGDQFASPIAEFLNMNTVRIGNCKHLVLLLIIEVSFLLVFLLIVGKRRAPEIMIPIKPTFVFSSLIAAILCALINREDAVA